MEIKFKNNLQQLIKAVLIDQTNIKFNHHHYLQLTKTQNNLRYKGNLTLTRIKINKIRRLEEKQMAIDHIHLIIIEN